MIAWRCALSVFPSTLCYPPSCHPSVHSPSPPPSSSNPLLESLRNGLDTAALEIRGTFVLGRSSRWTRLARWDERTGRRCRRGSISTETVFCPTLSPLVGQFARGKKKKKKKEFFPPGGTPRRGGNSRRLPSSPVEKVSSARETRGSADAEGQWLARYTDVYARTETRMYRRG